MAAAGRAAARSIASHRGHFDESFFADEEPEHVIGANAPTEARLRASHEAMGKAQERFAMGGQLQALTITFDEKCQEIINNEPLDEHTLLWWQWYMVCMTESFTARIVIISLVIVNGMIIGIEADHGGPEGALFFQVAEYFFVIAFTLEVVCKVTPATTSPDEHLWQNRSPAMGTFSLLMSPAVVRFWLDVLHRWMERDRRHHRCWFPDPGPPLRSCDPIHAFYPHHLSSPPAAGRYKRGFRGREGPRLIRAASHQDSSPRAAYWYDESPGNACKSLSPSNETSGE